MENTRQVEVLDNGWRKVVLPNGKIRFVPPVPQPVVVTPDNYREPESELVLESESVLLEPEQLDHEEVQEPAHQSDETSLESEPTSEPESTSSE